MESVVSSTVSFLNIDFENITYPIITSDYDDGFSFVARRLKYVRLLKWFLRLVCLVSIFLCPWANYQLIRMFQTRSYHKQSAAKWYIIFKAVFDTLFLLASAMITFFITFGIDIVHRNVFSCKFIFYFHYVLEDLIPIMFTLLCIDRMIRLTCGYRLRTRFTLIVCIIATAIFMIFNLHHVIRLKHQYGFCHKSSLGFIGFEFDILYSTVFTIVTWIIIFIVGINLTVSVWCDRSRRQRLLRKQKEQLQKQNLNNLMRTGGDPIGSSNDRLELIDNADDWDDAMVVTIERNDSDNRPSEFDNRDDLDLQLTVCVLISSVIFLTCNLPYLILFIMKYLHHLHFSTGVIIITYLSIVPIFLSNTISYFIFNHLAACLFSHGPS